MFSSILAVLSSTSPTEMAYSRRLLLHTPLYKSPATRDPSAPYGGNSQFDSHIIVILSALLCTLIFALALNLIIRCGLRCINRPPLVPGGIISSAPAVTTTTGLKKRALKMFPLVSYSTELNLPGLASECVICISEFVREERIKVLPKCNHGFHAKCIDKWLESHTSCPTCRRCLLDTCKKITGCDMPGSTHLAPIIVPLETEGGIVNYRSSC